MLRALKEYISQQRTVSMWQLVQKFQLDAEVLRDMLRHWQRKGVITCQQKTPLCGKACQKCMPNMVEVYQLNTSAVAVKGAD
jgi:hypothetical protein